MQSETLKKLVIEIQKQKSESQTIELKSAEHGCPTRLFNTLSSFSNQDDGGILIFGMDEHEGYTISGVYDPQDLQKKLPSNASRWSALFTMCSINGKTVVSAEIPGVDISKRPVFYKGVGRMKGSYVRVGESDEPMSEYEIYSYETFRQRIRDDIRIIENAKIQLFDENRISHYLHAIKAERKNLAEHVTDKEILELMGVIEGDTPTLAGLMTFSRYPQAHFPQLCITAVSLPGTEQGTVGEDGERFLDNKRITGAIPDMPELLKVTENRFSGIPTMCTEFLNAGLPVPTFSVVHGEFKVVMKNSFYTENTNISDAIIAFCTIPRSRAELIAFTGKSRTYTMSQMVQPLIDNGSLKLTLPEKPKSSKQKYVKALP